MVLYTIDIVYSFVLVMLDCFVCLLLSSFVFLNILFNTTYVSCFCFFSGGRVFISFPDRFLFVRLWTQTIVLNNMFLIGFTKHIYSEFLSGAAVCLLRSLYRTSLTFGVSLNIKWNFIKTCFLKCFYKQSHCFNFVRGGRFFASFTYLFCYVRL